MKNISNHIRDLLHWHECVIIPGLGGVVTNYMPAYIHPATHVFEPPSLALAFNPSLAQNDGLLTKHIAKAENLSYQTAARQVENWVEETREKVNNGEQVVLQGIGSFKLDVENNTRFVPDQEANFLLESYGLRQFQASPVLREADRPVQHAASTGTAQATQQSTAQHVEEQQDEQPTQPQPASEPVADSSPADEPKAASAQVAGQPAATPHPAKRRGSRNFAIAATLLAIIALGQLMFFNLSPNQFSLGYLPVFEQFDPVTEDELVPEESTKEATTEKDDLDNGEYHHSLRYPKPAVDGFEADNDANRQKIAHNGYYVILGSFQERANAEQLREKISDKPNPTIFQSQKGYHRVGYFLDKEEHRAIVQLNQLQAQHGNDLWLNEHR